MRIDERAIKKILSLHRIRNNHFSMYMKRNIHTLPFKAHSTAWLTMGACHVLQVGVIAFEQEYR